MKFNKFILLVIFSLSVKIASAQSQEELKKMFRDTYNRALTYNDRFEAKSALYRLIALEPQNDSILSTLAYLYIDAGQYASSALVSQDVLKLNPGNTGALEMSGISYEKLGLKDKSLESFELLFLLTDDFQILYKMAFLQFDLEKYQQALTNADILLEKPESKEATVFYTEGEEQKEYSISVAILNLKGLVYKEIGNIEEAKKSYEQALAIAPGFVLAKENLAALDQ